MKTFSAALIALTVAFAPAAHAEVIAGKLTKFDNGTSSMILLSNEVSKQCDQYFPGTRFAAMKIASSRTAQVLYQYPGCYAMREKGDISVSFWDDSSRQWVAYTLKETLFEKTAMFKQWPGAPKGYVNYQAEADQLFDAIVSHHNEEAR